MRQSEQETEAELWEALHQELIVRSEDSYRFVHDRIQEAAYSLIAAETRAEAHLRIGRLLNAHTPPEKHEEAIFEIVNQFNRGASARSHSEDERFQVAELNLVAGKRAKASTAYASALKYFIAGVALLTNDPWERHHDLIFQLELHRAECEFLTGELTIAAERVEMLRSRAANTVELGDGHVPGYRCLHDARSDRPCNRDLPRLPAPSRYRLAAPSNGGTGTKRIRTDLVTARKSRDRGSYGLPPDERPHVYRDSGCSDQGIELCIVYGYESFCPGRLRGG